MGERGGSSRCQHHEGEGGRGAEVCARVALDTRIEPRCSRPIPAPGRRGAEDVQSGLRIGKRSLATSKTTKNQHLGTLHLSHTFTHMAQARNAPSMRRRREIISDLRPRLQIHTLVLHPSLPPSLPPFPSLPISLFSSLLFEIINRLPYLISNKGMYSLGDR